jgi:hypothetical protein
MPSAAILKGEAMKTRSAGTETTTGICDLTQLNVNMEPFPHVIHEQFITPELYAQLCRSFPTCPPSTGPTGFSLYWGDEEYERLLSTHPAWRALFDTFQSQTFIDWAQQQFGAVWQSAGCKINPSAARYVPYREHRIDKERAKLRKVEHEPHELWVRMDIHQGQIGYDRRIHLDHARRLISLLIYMCDHEDSRMTGGELCLHATERRRPSPQPLARITPRHNLMVAFPCTADSYHSVPQITEAATPRNYIQVHISSSVDIWPRKASSEYWKRARAFLKRRLQHGQS